MDKNDGISTTSLLSSDNVAKTTSRNTDTGSQQLKLESLQSLGKDGAGGGLFAQLSSNAFFTAVCFDVCRSS